MSERIYVIEDDENIQEIIKLSLESSGYQITLFNNAIDAIVAIHEDTPDLAIFDVMLPEYMKKPFGVLELAARVRSLLRRSQHHSKVIKTTSLEIDKSKHIILKQGEKLELTHKEYQLLLYLVENKERVVEREELLNNIWGYDFVGESRALDVHIRSLRAKLGDDGHHYIKTIRSVGYRFIEDGQ